MTEQPCPAPDQAELPPDNADTPASIVRRSGRLRTEQQWEIVRQLLHPMLMQNQSGQAIADAFGVSADTAYRWKRRLLEDLRKEAVTMQPRDFVMESISSLRQVRAEAWAGFYRSANEKDKRASLSTVIQAEAQFARMGERVGFYGRPGQSPMDANTYGEARNGDQSDTTMVRELQYRLIELLSTSDTRIECSDDDRPEPYDDLLSELRTVPSTPTALSSLRVTLPARRRQRIRSAPS